MAHQIYDKMNGRLERTEKEIICLQHEAASVTPVSVFHGNNRKHEERIHLLDLMSPQTEWL